MRMLRYVMSVCTELGKFRRGAEVARSADFVVCKEMLVVHRRERIRMRNGMC